MSYQPNYEAADHLITHEMEKREKSGLPALSRAVVRAALGVKLVYLAEQSYEELQERGAKAHKGINELTGRDVDTKPERRDNPHSSGLHISHAGDGPVYPIADHESLRPGYRGAPEAVDELHAIFNVLSEVGGTTLRYVAHNAKVAGDGPDAEERREFVRFLANRTDRSDLMGVRAEYLHATALAVALIGPRPEGDPEHETIAGLWATGGPGPDSVVIPG